VLTAAVEGVSSLLLLVQLSKDEATDASVPARRDRRWLVPYPLRLFQAKRWSAGLRRTLPTLAR
jgi:hypothetical protein